MFESGVLSRGHRSSCFWVGTLFPKSLSVSMWILGPDHLSDCQFAQWHILSQTSARGGGTIKTKGPDVLFCPWSDLVFIFFIFIFLSWMNAQSSACSSLLWSAEKLQWILFGSVWDFVLEVHLYMWLMSTPAASLSVLYGQVLHYRCITLRTYWFFLSASILTIYWIGGENVLLLWKRKFNRLRGKKKSFFHWLRRVGSAIFQGSPPACSIITL